MGGMAGMGGMVSVKSFLFVGSSNAEHVQVKTWVKPKFVRSNPHHLQGKPNDRSFLRLFLLGQHSFDKPSYDIFSPAKKYLVLHMKSIYMWTM